MIGWLATVQNDRPTDQLPSARDHHAGAGVSIKAGSRELGTADDVALLGRNLGECIGTLVRGHFWHARHSGSCREREWDFDCHMWTAAACGSSRSLGRWCKTAARTAAEHQHYRGRPVSALGQLAGDTVVHNSAAELTEVPRRRQIGGMEPSYRAVRTRPDGSSLADGASERVLSLRLFDIMLAMKQLLLRVPDDVHRRLAARAAREGRSVNAVATEILDAAADADVGDRRARLRARAAGLGVVRELAASNVSAARRHRIIASTDGLGPLADRLLADERDRT